MTTRTAPTQTLLRTFDTRTPLGIICTATAVRTLGRGVFFTLTVLYLTRIAGMSVAEVATLLTIANAVGVLSSYAGGRLADVVSARRIVQVLLVVEGVALASYTAVTSFGPALTVACLVAAANRGGSSALSAVLARGFRGSERVRARALTRTITNAGIAVGGGVAGIALLLDTAAAYRTTMVLAGGAYLAASWICRRLPASVDAAPRDRTQPVAGRGPVRDPRYVAMTFLAAVFSLQFAVTEIAMPIWVTEHTSAPPVMVSVLLLVNTVVVIALQVPLSRRTHQVPVAARAVLSGALCMAAACLVFAVSGETSGVALTVALLLVAMLVISLGEVLQQSGVFGLAFELAPISHAGAYQGFFGMGYAVGQTVAPLVVAHTILRAPLMGWTTVAAMLATAGAAMVVICRGAEPQDEPTPDAPSEVPSDRAA